MTDLEIQIIGALWRADEILREIMEDRIKGEGEPRVRRRQDLVLDRWCMQMERVAKAYREQSAAEGIPLQEV